LLYTMGKKGVSADEKRQRMLSMIRTSGHVWTMKDIEKGAGSIGIVSQAVKDVLKQLTDDDFVREGKVGVSTYYWSFPAEAATKKRGELHRAARDVALLRQQVQEAEAAKQQHNATVQQLSPEEEKRIRETEARVVGMHSEMASIHSELEAIRKASTMDVHARKRDIPTLKEAANRWTDNVFEVRSQIVQKFGLTANEVNQQLELPELDYID